MTDPQLKSLIDDILNKYLNYISPKVLKDFIFNLIEKQYTKGLEIGEVNFNMNFVPDYKAVSFIQKFAFDNVTKLTEDTKDNLRKEMAMGLMNGESISKLKLRIMDVMDTTIDRAEMITRTESVRAFNVGHFQAAKESGLELKKQWSTHEDERTCESCGYLDGQIVDMDKPFKDQKGKESLLSPFHVRCRCRVIYVQPHEPKINNI
jgi:SPP1 gp7 family putative phage head morphogenesis protein